MMDAAALVGVPVLGTAGITEIDHIGLAVQSIAECLPVYQGLLCGTLVEGGDVSGDFRAVQLMLPGRFKVELMEPLDPAGALAGFLETRGPGLHHVTARCADVEASVRAVIADGRRVIGASFVEPGWREAYVHPGDTGGVLIQLYDSTTQPPPGPTTDWSCMYGIDEILAGRRTWLGGEFVPKDTGPTDSRRPDTHIHSTKGPE